MPVMSPRLKRIAQHLANNSGEHLFRTTLKTASERQRRDRDWLHEKLNRGARAFCRPKARLAQ